MIYTVWESGSSQLTTDKEGVFIIAESVTYYIYFPKQIA